MSHSSWEMEDAHTGLHSSRGAGSVRTPTHALFSALDEKTWKIRGDDILGILPVKYQKMQSDLITDLQHKEYDRCLSTCGNDCLLLGWSF